MFVAAALNKLKNQRKRLKGQLREVENAISTLTNPSGGSTNGGRQHKLSAAGRARIVAAQKKRWAKFKAKKFCLNKRR